MGFYRDSGPKNKRYNDQVEEEDKYNENGERAEAHNVRKMINNAFKLN